ncbi:MAG: MmgE/PrpD family protein [Gaiellaceae bacterium]
MPPATLTQQLLRAGEPAHSSSPAVLGPAGRAFFDWLCCVRAGEAAGRAWPGDSAAKLAVAAHALDRDDLHHASLTHPGGVVWSGIAGATRGLDVSLASALAAGAYGYEVMTRLAAALGPEHRRYWHATATAGTVGAAVGASAALGGTAADVEAAAGHAVSVVGGSSRAILERSGTRYFHRAHAASTGVAAAQAAAAGVAATRFGLEGDDGLLAAAAGGGAADALVQPAERTAVETTGVRFYGANGFAHGAIEAAAQLGPIAPDEIAAALVTVSAATARLASNRSPATDEEAWWSVEHAVAVCLAAGSPVGLTGGLSPEEPVRALARRVTLAVADIGWGSQVEVTLRDGATAVGSCTEPLGHPARPVTDEQLLAKWQLLAGTDGSELLSAVLSAAGGLDETLELALGRAALDLYA